MEKELNREEMLDSIREAAEKLNRTPLRKETPYTGYEYLKIFGGYKAAVLEVGLPFRENNGISKRKTRDVHMADLPAYAQGIILATARFEKTRGKIIVTNVDKFYPNYIAQFSGNEVYFQMDAGKKQYVLKFWIDDADQTINQRNEKKYFPCLETQQEYLDFLRAWIEIHGVLDYCKSDNWRRMRLRIYGSIEMVERINCLLEEHCNVPQKSVQILHNKKTGVIAFASQEQVERILQTIDGEPRNDVIWEKWEEIRAKPKIPYVAKRKNRKDAIDKIDQ